MFIDPEIQTVLDEFPLDFGALDDERLAVMREGVNSLPRPEPSEAVERTDHVIDSGDGPDVTVTVHRPTAKGNDRMGLVWMHGGGLILGARTMDDARFDKWCPKFDMTAISVEYRLAPETPYPGPLDDCYLALAWVHENASELGIDPSNIGVGGASAGGGLAAALALLARDRGEFAVAWQLLIYPMLDDRQQTISSRWDAPVWPPAANTYGWRAYLGDSKGGSDVPAYAAAARAEELGGLGPAIVSVGGADGFLDEDIDYANRLLHAGVATDLRVYPGAIHGFDSLVPDAAVSRQAIEDIEEWLARR